MIISMNLLFLVSGQCPIDSYVAKGGVRAGSGGQRRGGAKGKDDMGAGREGPGKPEPEVGQRWRGCWQGELKVKPMWGEPESKVASAGQARVEGGVSRASPSQRWHR